MRGNASCSLEAVRRGEYEVLRDDGPAAVLLVADLAAVLRGAHLHRRRVLYYITIFVGDQHTPVSEPPTAALRNGRRCRSGCGRWGGSG